MGKVKGGSLEKEGAAVLCARECVRSMPFMVPKMLSGPSKDKKNTGFGSRVVGRRSFGYPRSQRVFRSVIFDGAHARGFHDESRIRSELTEQALSSHTKTKLIFPQNGHSPAKFGAGILFFTEVSRSGVLATSRNSRACARRSSRLRLLSKP